MNLPVRIVGTGSVVMGRPRNTSEILRQAYPGADEHQLRRIAERTGIETRYWIDRGTPAARLAFEALKLALEEAGMGADRIRRIILATSTGGDHLVPSTASDVAALLGLSDTCDAFDLSNSCVGFLSALDVGARSVATGIGPVAVVAVETFSRLLSPEGPRAYAVLGDGAAAVILQESPKGGILASHLRRSQVLADKMKMDHSFVPGARPFHDFDARSHELEESAVICVRRCVQAVLDDARLSLDEIEWVLPHQPNGSLYRTLLDSLGVDPSRAMPIVAEVGSLGAASVPTSLDRLMRSGRVQAGHRVLMASVGAGTSYGAVLYEAA